MDEMDLLTTCIHHSDLYFTDHWHRPVSSVYYSLHKPFPGNGFQQWRFSASRARVLLLQPPVQNSCQLTINWVPGWRSIHTNLLVFSQADFQLNWTELTTELSHSPISYFTSLHSTELLTILCRSSAGVLVIQPGDGHNIKHRLLQSYCFHGLLPSDRQDIVSAGMRSPSRCLETDVYPPIA
jgi:hypothetical protein